MVECVETGTSRGPSQGEYRPNPAVGATAALSAAVPTSVDPEAAALGALRAQADADRTSVQSDLADRWVPQLSSKRVGLVAPDVDGRIVTWSATENLNQHLRMRLQYPEVRLVWSDEWRTFDLRGWWVTIAGATFHDASAANGWCDSRGIAVDECFAKLVSNSRDSSGTTQYPALVVRTHDRPEHEIFVTSSTTASPSSVRSTKSRGGADELCNRRALRAVQLLAGSGRGVLRRVRRAGHRPGDRAARLRCRRRPRTRSRPRWP